METQNIMASSFPLKDSSTQNKGSPFSSCLAQGVWYYISMFGKSQSFTDNFNLIILVEVQQLHENGK